MEGCLMEDCLASGPAWTLGGRSLFRLATGGIEAVAGITLTWVITFFFLNPLKASELLSGCLSLQITHELA